jgi:hypothetical protein
MRSLLAFLLVLAASAGVVPGSASAELPKRDFTIELREVQDRDASGTTVATQAPGPGLMDQSVRVRNGEKATLRFNVAMPVQWVQKLETSATAASTASAPAGQTTGSAISNALTWMEAGQSMVVTPRWTSAKQPVVIEIELQSAAVQPGAGSELPSQLRTQATTTVSAPLGEWVTVATEGQRQPDGVYRSDAGSSVPKLIQIRVLARP